MAVGAVAVGGKKLMEGFDGMCTSRAGKEVADAEPTKATAIAAAPAVDGPEPEANPQEDSNASSSVEKKGQ